MLSFWYYFKLGFLITYFSICAGIAYIIYKDQKKYYEPMYIMKKTGEGKDDEKAVNIHDEFDECARKDTPVSFIKLFFGILTIALFKFILAVYFAITLSFKLNNQLKKKEEKKEKFTKEEIKSTIETIKYHTSNFLRYSGIFHFKVRLPEEKVLPVYQKYFGPDYKIDYDGKVSCYICNHTSFNDILLAMTIYGCAFISKEGIKKTPVFGSIAQGLQSIFVNRNDPNSRKEVLDKILERQKDYMEGKAVLPLMIFPEGTTTSGRHILKFKKGAFYSLLPIKPNIIHPNLIRNLHLGCGASNVNINYARTLTELYVQTEYIELPIMTPNEYMYTNFASYGKEKWEIYAEVAREIMCSLGDFKKSDKDLKDSFRYIHILESHTYVEKEKFKMD